jgi:hypothetical protein
MVQVLMVEKIADGQIDVSLKAGSPARLEPATISAMFLPIYANLAKGASSWRRLEAGLSAWLANNAVCGSTWRITMLDAAAAGYSCQRTSAACPSGTRQNASV